ncbi:CMRF35-like molecule 5 isoform X1 [Syngnathus scovelli]|uniref:CMRF35-like molecule 5 isoform X1 n=1 Tax=Syngnathus scovelli TaxID=161590 RepID=UPI0021108C86|nr:CMRF35-like molecule 5 isoform X2 [Syngnathus scovelli]
MEIFFLVLAFLMHGTANTETEVTGVSGESVLITCSNNGLFDNAKYFCEKNCGYDDDVLIKSKEKMRWYSKGRYSIKDEGKTFRVIFSQLTKKDAGTYWCGWERWLLLDNFEKVVLTVREGTTKAPKQDKPTTKPTEQFRPSTPSSRTKKPPTNPPEELLQSINDMVVTPENVIVGKSNLTLLVVAVTCAGSVCVCLCTLILLVTRKAQQVIPQQNVQMSSDYEIMMPAVRNEGHCGASSPRCIAHLEDAPKEPTVENQEYAGCLGVSEYVNLQLSQVEEYVYHDLCSSKEIPKGKHLGH